MVTSYNNSIAALYEQAQHHANRHPHQGHNLQEDEVEVTPAVKPQSKAGASYKPKPRPSPHHLLLVVRRVHAFPAHLFLVVLEKGALAGICVVLLLLFLVCSRGRILGIWGLTWTW